MEVKAWTLDGTFTESFLLVVPQGGNSCFRNEFGKFQVGHEAASPLEGKGSIFCLYAEAKRGWSSLKLSLSVDGKCNCIISCGSLHVSSTGYTTGTLA